tara:strand:- start:8158 stop:10317 length:2160 start_codon:yes stop_codon:yes gene_type:complete
MARKKKTPLYKKEDKKEDKLDLTTDVLGGDLLQSDAVRDQMHGADITKAGSGVQQLDMSGLDEYISKIEKPASKSVFDKQAAYYRQKGEGDVLRVQKDLANLFIPTIALWQEREEAANAKFEMLKKQMPEFDDSKIFGEGGPNKIPMPVVDEIKNISTSVKTDLRELSRMNINDPRYDELRKKVEKDQAVIKQFHDINQKLLAIRNDVGTDENGSQIKLGNNIQGDWSATMSDNEKAMWTDIYNSNGENIKVIDGKLMWVPEGKVSYEFKGGTVGELHADDKWVALGSDNTILGSLAGATRDIKTGKQQTGEELSEEGGTVLYVQKLLKKLYPDHDFGGTGENEDGMDNKWGNKTQAAYEMYLRDKDKLETEWLNENLSEEDKEKYQVITPGKNIDLATIGDGPTMKDGIAFKTHLASIERLGRGLQGGATPKGNQFQINTYKALRLTIEEDFKRLGVEGQASLLFDGVGRIGESDALRVDGFLHNIMTNNSDKFPGYKSLNEEERIEAWDKIREGGMLETYTLNGKTATLQTHFKDFYMGEIDKRAMSYVPPRKNRKRKKGNNTSNNFNKDFSNLSERIVSSLNDIITNTPPGTDYETTQDKLGSTVDIKLPSINHNSVVYPEATLIINPLKFEQGNPYAIKLGPNLQPMSMSIENLITTLANVYGTDEKQIKDFLEKTNKEYMEKTKTLRKTASTKSEEEYGTIPPDEVDLLDMSKG